MDVTLWINAHSSSKCSSSELMKSLFFLFSFHQKYLKDYHFQNAKTANFWASLANVCSITYMKREILILNMYQKGHNTYHILTPALTLSHIHGIDINLNFSLSEFLVVTNVCFVPRWVGCRLQTWWIHGPNKWVILCWISLSQRQTPNWARRDSSWILKLIPANPLHLWGQCYREDPFILSSVQFDLDYPSNPTKRDYARFCVN